MITKKRSSYQLGVSKIIIVLYDEFGPFEIDRKYNFSRYSL